MNLLSKIQNKIKVGSDKPTDPAIKNTAVLNDKLLKLPDNEQVLALEYIKDFHKLASD
jgi:hypothetical protein